MPTNGALAPTSDRIWRSSPRRRKTATGRRTGLVARIYTRRERTTASYCTLYRDRSVISECARVYVASLKSTKERKVKNCVAKSSKIAHNEMTACTATVYRSSASTTTSSWINGKSARVFDRWSTVANTSKMTSNFAGDNCSVQKVNTPCTCNCTM